MEDYTFEFVVENITKEQAGELMDAIISQVEAFGGRVGGGFWLTLVEEEGDDGQERPA